MTEYLTSSITPTLGNENKLILQGEKVHLGELWKSVIVFYLSVGCRNFAESRIAFFFFLFFPKHKQQICTELESGFPR